jgi:dTDP-4-dehydrorhamnose reductase
MSCIAGIAGQPREATWSVLDQSEPLLQMIILLGATGYVGQAFARELTRRGFSTVPLSRQALDYSRFELLLDYLRRVKPEFLINAAGQSWPADGGNLENYRWGTFKANVQLPQTIARACAATQTSWAHVSCGTVFTGAKVAAEGRVRVERDLRRIDVRRLFYRDPECFAGFTELDDPNVSFHGNEAEFCSGTKSLAEEVLRGSETTYVWRLQKAFSELDHPSNYLSRLLRHSSPTQGLVSLTHLGDAVRACLNLWQWSLPKGIYNISNPQLMDVKHICQLAQEHLTPVSSPDRYPPPPVHRPDYAREMGSNSFLDISKLRRSGIKMRPLKDALLDCFENWTCPGGDPVSTGLRQTRASTLRRMLTSTRNSLVQPSL